MIASRLPGATTSIGNGSTDCAARTASSSGVSGNSNRKAIAGDSAPPPTTRAPSPWNSRFSSRQPDPSGAIVKSSPASSNGRSPETSVSPSAFKLPSTVNGNFRLTSPDSCPPAWIRSCPRNACNNSVLTSSSVTSIDLPTCPRQRASPWSPPNARLPEIPPSAGKNDDVTPFNSSVVAGVIARSSMRSVPSRTPISSTTIANDDASDAVPSPVGATESSEAPAEDAVSRPAAGVPESPSGAEAPGSSFATGTIHPVASSGRTSTISGRTSRIDSTRSCLLNSGSSAAFTSMRPISIFEVSAPGAVKLAGRTPSAPRNNDNSMSPSSASQPVESCSTASICGRKRSTSTSAGKIKPAANTIARRPPRAHNHHRRFCRGGEPSLMPQAYSRAARQGVASPSQTTGTSRGS